MEETILLGTSTDGENYGVAFLSNFDYIRSVYAEFEKDVAEEIVRFGNTILTEIDDEEVSSELPAKVLAVGKKFYVLKKFLTADGNITVSSHGFEEESDAASCAKIVDSALHFDDEEFDSDSDLPFY